MTAFRTLVALSVAALASACANPGVGTVAPASPGPADAHAAHHPDASANMPMAAMESRMKAMQEMHQKMMNAKTPEERQALMADHMKAMQDGMDMMKDMSGVRGMGGMGGTSDMAASGGKTPMSGMGGGMGGMGGMTEGKGMPADMAKHHQMMAQRMNMMQMMMEMMMDRMPPAPASK